MLMSGTVLAQAAAFLLSIPLSRLYTPHDYGLFALFTSVTSMVSMIAAVRFDVTIVLPETNATAWVVKRLATRCAVVTAVILIVAWVFTLPWLGQMWGPNLAQWLVTAGPMVFLMAQTTILQYWLTRLKRFGEIAQNRVVQPLATGLLQLGLFWLIGGLAGLVVGAIVGQASALIVLYLRTRDTRMPRDEDEPTCWQVAKRYKKMPLVNGPNTVVDAVRLNGTNVLIALVAVEGLGQFNLAWRAMVAPISIVQGAIGQVLLQQLATVPPGKMYSLVRLAVRRMALFGGIVFGVLFIVAPWLFPLLFGGQWVEAGWIAQALVPWLYLVLLTTPVQSVYYVTERQPVLLVISIVYCAAAFGVLLASPWELLPTVWALSGATTVVLVVLLMMALREARRYDAGAVDGAS